MQLEKRSHQNSIDRLSGSKTGSFFEKSGYPDQKQDFFGIDRISVSKTGVSKIYGSKTVATSFKQNNITKHHPTA
jgi:hypothetical protein